jgi:hypothetical protein
MASRSFERVAVALNIEHTGDPSCGSWVVWGVEDTGSEPLTSGLGGLAEHHVALGGVRVPSCLVLGEGAHIVRVDVKDGSRRGRPLPRATGKRGRLEFRLADPRGKLPRIVLPGSESSEDDVRLFREKKEIVSELIDMRERRMRHIDFLELHTRNGKQEQFFRIVALPVVCSREDVPPFHLERFPEATGQVVPEDGVLLFGMVEVSEIELARAIEVELGGVLKGKTGSRDRALDKTVPVVTSDVVEWSNVGESSHGSRVEAVKRKAKKKRLETSSNVFV